MITFLIKEMFAVFAIITGFITAVFVSKCLGIVFIFFGGLILKRIFSKKYIL